MKVTQENIYKRQIILPEIGIKGQQKLLSAKIAIVGCGGLGSTAAVFLAASGIGHIHLVDYDLVDQSNLHRQVFYGTGDIGKLKSKVLASHINKISPFVTVSYDEKPVDKTNIEVQLGSFPIILDCTDSLITKYLLNDFCVISNKVLIYGSLYKHDGYVGTFNVNIKEKQSANLRDAFPEIPKQHIPNCAEIGTLNPVVGIIGLMQANEVIKLITGSGKSLINKLLIYNTMENSQFIMKLNPSFSRKIIVDLFQTDNYFDARCEIQINELLILSEELKKRINDSDIKIISVIEDTEAIIPFYVHSRIPFSKFDVSELNPEINKDIVVICNKGILSYSATRIIKEKYPDINVFSLKNGIEKYN